MHMQVFACTSGSHCSALLFDSLSRWALYPPCNPRHTHIHTQLSWGALVAESLLSIYFISNMVIVNNLTWHLETQMQQPWQLYSPLLASRRRKNGRNGCQNTPLFSLSVTVSTFFLMHQHQPIHKTHTISGVFSLNIPKRATKRENGQPLVLCQKIFENIKINPFKKILKCYLLISTHAWICIQMPGYP